MLELCSDPHFLLGLSDGFNNRINGTIERFFPQSAFEALCHSLTDLSKIEIYEIAQDEDQPTVQLKIMIAGAESKIISLCPAQIVTSNYVMGLLSGIALKVEKLAGQRRSIAQNARQLVSA